MRESPPVTETLHGHEPTDPYRWLEDDEAVHEGTADSTVYLVDEDARGRDEAGATEGPDEQPTDEGVAADTLDEGAVADTTDGGSTDPSEEGAADPASERATDPALAPIVAGVDAAFRPRVHGGTVHFETDPDAPFSRLLAVPVVDAAASDPLGPDAMAEPIPETDAVLQGVAFAGDRPLASHVRDAASEVPQRRGASVPADAVRDRRR